MRAAKDLAGERDQSLGRVLSDLARLGLEPREAKVSLSDGIPTLPRRPGAKPVTSKTVKELLELND